MKHLSLCLKDFLIILRQSSYLILLYLICLVNSKRKLSNNVTEYLDKLKRLHTILISKKKYLNTVNHMLVNKYIKIYIFIFVLICTLNV